MTSCRNSEQVESEEEAFRAALRLPPDVNANNKKAALDACLEEHAELLQCFSKSWSSRSCLELQKKFWECYRRERGFSRTVFSSVLSRGYIEIVGNDDRSSSSSS
uniref:COX assembly mitochondrial protein n=1 Tax=Tetraselmis sp. GSL018 TaxID=582737 RepID=A0A061R0N7_9CHLO